MNSCRTETESAAPNVALTAADERAPLALGEIGKAHRVDSDRDEYDQRDREHESGRPRVAVVVHVRVDLAQANHYDRSTQICEQAREDDHLFQTHQLPSARY